MKNICYICGMELHKDDETEKMILNLNGTIMIIMKMNKNN